MAPARAARGGRHAGPRSAGAHLLPRPHPQARGLFSFALDLLWTLFWLVAAACASAVLADNSWSGSKMQASVAFSWISFFLWCGDFFFLSHVCWLCLQRAPGYSGHGHTCCKCPLRCRAPEPSLCPHPCLMRSQANPASPRPAPPAGSAPPSFRSRTGAAACRAPRPPPARRFPTPPWPWFRETEKLFVGTEAALAPRCRPALATPSSAYETRPFPAAAACERRLRTRLSHPPLAWYCCY